LVSRIEDYAPVARVIEEVLSLLPQEPPEEKSPTIRAYGRVSSRDVRAKTDVPRLKSSHMDGLAVRSRDTGGASVKSPASLRLVGESRLGQTPAVVLRPGQAFRVSTGSFLPRGADAVVPIERATIEEDVVRVRSQFAPGSFVFEAGGDVRKGDVVIGRGRSIRAQDMALALSLGISSLDVYRRPVVALLATGSELVDPTDTRADKVRNTHTQFFARLLEEEGCVTMDLGIAPDDLPQIVGKVEKGLKRADALLTMGGTSVGRRDLTGEVISSMKPRLIFHGIRMDRGRVTGVAVVGRKPVVMMPGPVQGAMNAFILSGLPIIRRLSGRRGGDIVVRAALRSRWEARRRFPNFVKVLYVNVSLGGEGPVAEPLLGETESMTILTRSNAYLVVPEETTELDAGALVEAHLLPGFSFA
jgi:molybdenum cofactor synthesis domain-containing protein